MPRQPTLLEFCSSCHITGETTAIRLYHLHLEAGINTYTHALKTLFIKQVKVKRKCLTFGIERD
jgi:hypothetical protein